MNHIAKDAPYNGRLRHVVAAVAEIWRRSDGVLLPPKEHGSDCMLPSVLIFGVPGCKIQVPAASGISREAFHDDMGDFARAVLQRMVVTTGTRQPLVSSCSGHLLVWPPVSSAAPQRVSDCPSSRPESQGSAEALDSNGRSRELSLCWASVARCQSLSLLASRRV